MGNAQVRSHKEEECLICFEKFDDQIHTICGNCNIYMHYHCTQELLKEKTYCVCPHCQAVGTLMGSEVPTKFRFRKGSV